MSRFSFFAERPTGAQLMRWYDDVRAALGDFERRIVAAIDSGRSTPEAFLGMTAAEIARHFNEERDELEHVTSLALLAAAEAILRTDYLSRVYERRKDPVSRAFRQLYREKEKPKLDKDLLEIWKNHEPGCCSVVGEFRGAYKFRHWLAHGRYWTPKLGQDYDALSIFDIATRMFAKLPGVTGWP